MITKVIADPISSKREYSLKELETMGYSVVSDNGDIVLCSKDKSSQIYFCFFKTNKHYKLFEIIDLGKVTGEVQ